MKLKELNLKTEQRIRICTEHGGNFIYIGTAGELDFETLNNECYQRVRQAMLKAVTAFTKSKVNTISTLDNIFPEFRFYIPVEEREVIEQYSSYVEYDCLIIKITGRDGWIQYGGDMPPLDPRTMDIDGASTLVAAIYKGLCTELVHAYQTENKDHITYCEKEIRLNRYGFFDDPDGLIRGCRQRAGRE